MVVAVMTSPETPPAPPSWPLEPDAAAMRSLVEAVSERLIEHIETLPQQRASDLEDADEVARATSIPILDAGRPLDELLELLFERAIPKSFNAAGPGYLAFIPGGGIFTTAVAGLLADATNRYTGVWTPAPVLSRLELDVVRWFCDLVGYGAASLGFLTSGGSLATLSGVIAARCDRLPEDGLAGGTVYVSDQIHHSVGKAARLAGIPAKNVRTIETDELFRLRVDLVVEAIREDRAAGKQPFLIVASAGTTNTGAIDDLDALADLAEAEGLWLHADAAYGGFFLLTEHGRRRLSGLARADSITLDPHKGLFLPFGTGALIVRDRATLEASHGVWADYLPTRQDDPDRVDWCQISPELSRPYRGLKVWLPLTLHGVAAFRSTLQEKLDIIRDATEALRAIEGIRIVAEPELTVVPFSIDRPDLDAEALSAKNRELTERVNARGRVLISGTILRGVFTPRLCVLAFRTHADRVAMAIEDVREALAEIG